MTGNLDMGDHSIQKVGDPVNSDDVATKNYVDAEIGYISTPFLKLDGTTAMTGVLNMNDQKISNLKMPEFNTDAANKQYIDDKLLKSHLLTSVVVNAFKYLSDANESSSERDIIIHGIVDFQNSPHKNKKAYDIDLIYKSGTRNYSSKMGINIYPLDVGKYTIIMEYYFPEDLNIIIFAQASKQSTTIKKQMTVSESNFKRQLVQFDFTEKANPSYYLYFTISGSGTTSTNPEGYLVFYGVKGWDDSVPPELYDHALETGMFEYDNGNMKMYNDIDMNNHKIKNIPLPTDSNDLLTKESLIANDIYVTGKLVYESQSHQNYFYSYGLRTKLYNPHINFIIINANSNFYNRNDILHLITLTRRTTPLTAPKIQEYRISFSTSPTGNVKIVINRFFPCDWVTAIYTDIITNATFTISHLPFTFKPLPIR